MLLTLAIILLIAWLLGVVGAYPVGAFVHVSFVTAVVLFVVSLSILPALPALIVLSLRPRVALLRAVTTLTALT